MTPEERKAKARERYHANRDDILAKRREHDANHIKERRAQRNEWAKKNPDKVKAQKKRLRERHGEEINAKLREYMAQKPEDSDLTRSQIHRRKYYQAHRNDLLEKQRIYQKENREKINAYWRDKYKSDPEPIKRRLKKYFDSHRTQIRERCLHHYYANKGEYIKRSVAWAKSHPEVIRQRSRNWYERNREKSIAASINYHRCHRRQINQRAKEWREKSPKLQQWRENNRDKIAAANKRRWARYGHVFRDFQNSYGTRTPRRVAIYRKWSACEERCYICGLHLAFDEINVDHVHPVAKQGTNDIQNLMPAHKLCNIRKGDKLDYPIARPDLIEATAHIQAIPRNLAAQVRREGEARKLRRVSK